MTTRWANGAAMMAVGFMVLGCGGNQQTTTTGVSLPNDPTKSFGSGATRGDASRRQPDLGDLAELNGYVVLSSWNAWNMSVDRQKVSPDSAKIIALLGAKPLTVGFGSKGAAEKPFGIPYVVVGGDATRVPVKLEDKEDTLPIPLTAPSVETSPDHRLVVLDRDAEKLYEFTGLAKGENMFKASSLVTVDLRSKEIVPTNVVFPGLVRHDEASDRRIINHALGFFGDEKVAFGTRLRLKKSYKEGKLSESTLVILRALKHYGMNCVGHSDVFTLLGTPDPKWKDADLAPLATLKPSDFEVVPQPATGKRDDKSKTKPDAATAAPISKPE